MLDTATIRPQFPILETSVHGKPLIYLDNAATTQKPLAVLDAIRHYYDTENANVHRGSHYLSQLATEAHEESRETVARFINAPETAEVLFTSGCTMGINLAADTIAASGMVKPGDEVIVTASEHHSNICLLYTSGNVTLENQVFLAPMAGVTDLPFRLLCREMGTGLVCSEMVSAKAIYYKNKNTESLLEIHEKERPVSLQLFGSDPELMAEMAKRIEERPFSILDINMGCPVPKVVNNGEGSALMKDPLLAGKIISAVAGAIHKPVTVKIRKGFDDSCVNAVEIARIAQESGAAAVAVHGRTREQYYAGQADWDIIARVKAAVSIPVIGNGDVTGPEAAERMLKETGCDAVLIGRAARGNPWIFRRTIHYLDTGELLPSPPIEEVREMMLRHAALLTEYKGEYTAIREMRKHVCWYTAGYPHSARLRERINEMETMQELEAVIRG